LTFHRPSIQALPVERSIGWVLMAGLLACTAPSSTGTRSPGRNADNYLRWVAFEVPINEHVLLRWPERKMPLRVYFPRPPEGLFEDPEAIYDSVRAGIVDWSGVAGPDLPSFVFVGDQGDADIPIVWEEAPDGDWYIAHCAYDVNVMSRRFGVSRILITGRWSADQVATPTEVYRVVLHEMGHALGLGGHSPQQGDIMYGSINRSGDSLSARDRATLQALYARPIGKRVVGARSDR
jgi:predicted Zn-dependent protease